jgi:hypothetical protein
LSYDVLKDARDVTNFYFALTLVYLGYDLYKIEVNDQNKQVFTILVPEEDQKILLTDYLSGKLAVSDVQELGRTHTRITKILKEMRRDQSNRYVNPDYTHLANQMSRVS